MSADRLMRLTQSLGIGRAIVSSTGQIIDANDSGRRTMMRLGLRPCALLRSRADLDVVGQHNGWTSVRVDAAPGPVVVHHRRLAENGDSVLVMLDPLSQPEIGLDLLRSIFQLTPTEVKVAQLVMAGATNSCIAKRLNIGPGTARTHIKSLYAKTGTRRQAQLTAMLWRMCFLPYSASQHCAEVPVRKAS